MEKRTLFVRQAKFGDIAAIVALLKKVYPETLGLSPQHLRGPLSRFPEGQFVAFYEDEIVGVCLTFRIMEDVAKRPHSWAEITGNGFASRHDPDGNVLYGMEVAVDPEARGLKIGQRLYNARKKLAAALRLKGIVFAGRMPGYKKAPPPLSNTKGLSGRGARARGA